MYWIVLGLAEKNDDISSISNNLQICHIGCV